jgi:hypothetical protein
MKTLSERFRFIVLGVIVTIAVISCCDFPFIPSIALYSVEIGGHELQGKISKRTYVEWKNEGDFDKALAQVCAHQGTYCIYVKRNDGDPDPTHSYQPSDPPSNCTDCRLGNIRTVKVTKSKAADNLAAGESAVGDPHATYRIQSPDPKDISDVLKTLKQ